MALEKPPHIAGAPLADIKANFLWDEWNVRGAYEPPDEELFERYGELTHRAQVAMTIATAEWIVFRFERLSGDPLPSQYLEAAWAANVDLAYSVYIETDDDDWRGPIRGPLNMAIAIVVDALYCADQSADTAENPAWMSNLAERVLPVEALPAFQAWRDASLERLEKYYSELPLEETEGEEPDELADLFAEEEDEGGPPVPREVFDPSFDFRPEQIPELINKYLARLRPEANEFLNSPEDLRENGFRGLPYVYATPDGRVDR